LIVGGEFYLSQEDYEALEALKPGEGHVRRRYGAVKLLLQPRTPFTVRQVAERYGVSERTVQRWSARYRASGVAGLKDGTRRPKRIHRKVTEEDEAAIVALRARTGLGPARIKVLLDASRAHDPDARTYSQTTVAQVLRKHGLVEARRRKLKAYRRFEWSKPRELVQLDLTAVGPFPVATALDDHSRRLWTALLEEVTDREVWAWMGGLPRFRNLLTDNGSQFSRSNGVARSYCHETGTHHIWATVGHPETLGKASRKQRDLKQVLLVAGWANREDLARKLRALTAFLNHACVHRGTGQTPVQREGAPPDGSWFLEFVYAFGLQDVLIRGDHATP
jgi:transposase